MRRVLGVCLVGVAACSDAPPLELKISALPASIAVGDGKFTTITVTAAGETQLQNGTQIKIVTTSGSFDANQDALTETDIEIAAGKAVVKLYAAPTPGSATVTAQYIDAYGKEYTKDATVNFTTPPVTRLTFSCATRNVGAFINAEDIQVRCEATPYDENGQPVRAVPVKFLTEAGEFTVASSNDEGKRNFIYNPSAGGRKPKNVAPLGDAVCNDTAGEPCWLDPTVAGSTDAKTRNPRDGLVTLVAYVETPNEFGDAEPFVDMDDDKQWDSDEPYFDANKNKEHDDDQTTVIWKQIKILWTDTLGSDAKDFVTFVKQGSTTDIKRTEKLTVTYTLLDKNLNVLAANSVEDAVSFEYVGEGNKLAGGFSQGSSRTLERNFLGIDVSENGDIKAPTQRSTYMLKSTYEVILENTLGPDDDPGPYEVFGSISRKYAVDEEGAATGDLSTEKTPYISGRFLK